MEAGVKKISIVLGDIHPEKVKEYYGDGSAFNAKISYIYQEEPVGIAHAVGLCKEFVGEDPFIVYLGDNLLKGGIKNFAKRFKNSNLDTMILLCEVNNPQRFGVAKFDKNGKLMGLIEKPKEPPSNYALTGIYFLRPTIFDMIKRLKPSWRGELEITEAVQLLIDNGYNIGYNFVTGWWKDTGTPEDILEANRLVLDELKPKVEGKVEDEKSIQSRVSIALNSTVRKGALVRGPTTVGENTLIESGVYIGPYTSIGNNVAIKRGEVENSIIMDHCLIDVNERIIDSLVAPHSKIVSSGDNKPSGRRFILGEKSHIEL